MTTIAFREGILAADTQLTFSGGLKGLTKKIEKLDNGMVVAVAGDVDKEFWWKQAIQGTKIPKENRNFKGIEAIVLDGTKVYHCYDDIALIELHTQYDAAGHGRGLALAGMSINMSAKDAVKFAGGINIYTNQIVDIYDQNKKRFTYGK